MSAYVFGLGIAVIALSMVASGTGGSPPPSATTAGRTITAYTMPWCGACKRLQPEWDRLVAMQDERLRVLKVDCEADEGACANVSSYPTIVSSTGAVFPPDAPRTAEAMYAWATS